MFGGIGVVYFSPLRRARMNTGTPWTPAEEATLHTLRAEGLNNAQIGERLNRSRNAIDKKMRHLQLTANRADKLDRNWEDADADQALALFRDGMSMTAIGLQLGRGRNSIRGLIARHKAERRNEVAWPAERLERARKLYFEERASYTDMATALGCKRGSISGIVSRQGWKRDPEQPANHALKCRATRTDRPRVKRVRKPPSNVLKFGGARMSPTITPPVVTTIEPTPETAVTLVQRTGLQCCYPVGEATGAEQMFCGGQRASGDYCAWHRGVMYQQRRVG